MTRSIKTVIIVVVIIAAVLTLTSLIGSGTITIPNPHA